MVFLAVLRVLAAAVAVVPAPSATPSTPPEIVRVVTSDRTDESIVRAARTTYVVTSSQMTQLGYRTVADALSSVPGVNIEHYGAFGAGTEVSIRGSSVAQVLVLVDGLPAAGQQTGSFDFEGVSTQGLDRIEVVEGGGSTLYGSSSIGGVVNIITRKQTGYDALVSVGSFAQSTYKIDTPYMSFERTYAGNAYPLPDGSTRQNADGSLSSGSLHYAHTIGKFNAAVYASLGNLTTGAPNEDGFFSATSRQTNVNQDARATLSYSHNRSFTTLDLGASRLSVTFDCDTAIDTTCLNSYLTPPPASFASLYSESRAGFSLRNVVGDQSYRFIYGVDMSRGTGSLDDGVDPVAVNPYSQRAVYAQSQWFAQNGNTFYVGLRGERDSSSGAASPSLGGILNLSKTIAVKANASSAFRAPTLEELYYPGASNERLAPEHTGNLDATLVDHDILGGTSLGWFSTTGSNLITFDIVSFKPQNVQRAALQGLIFSTQTTPLHGYSASLDVTNLYQANDLSTGARLDNRGPVLKVRTGLHYTAGATSHWDSLGIFATTEGARGYVNYAVPTFDQAAPCTRIDAFATYRVTPKLLLTLRGTNLGNDRYGDFGSFSQSSAAFYLFPMPGRSFALELRTR